MDKKYDPYSEVYAIKYDDTDISVERILPSNLRLRTIHTVLEGETIQSIAFKYYKDSGYWVRIAEFNNLFFPLRELSPGDQIKIPY